MKNLLKVKELPNKNKQLKKSSTISSMIIPKSNFKEIEGSKKKGNKLNSTIKQKTEKKRKLCSNIHLCDSAKNLQTNKSDNKKLSKEKINFDNSINKTRRYLSSKKNLCSIKYNLFPKENSLTSRKLNDTSRTNKSQKLNRYQDNGKNIKVYIRFRPMNEIENNMLENEVGWTVPKFLNDHMVSINSTKEQEEDNITKKTVQNTYNYNKVFNDKTNQEEIYQEVGKSLIEDVMSGYNGTIFTYGQSGSGKTYTMYGSDIYNPMYKGLIPRMIEDMFGYIEKEENENVEFQFKLSVMEIYKEVVYDLLTQEKDLKIQENPISGTFVDGLSEVYLCSLEDFFEYVGLALSNRKVAETKLNHNSSRSHCILILEVLQKLKKENLIKKGILNLVDLAGSEKVSKTGAVGETLEEAKKINLSLSTLGNVIHALTHNSEHVPYRDSKLTRLLKESLGGNYKTSVIVTCSPHSYNLGEIVSSLQFADRIKAVKNSVKVNIKYSYDQLQRLVDGLKKKLRLANDKILKLGGNIKEGNLSDERKEKVENSSSDTSISVCENCSFLKEKNNLLEKEIARLKEKLNNKNEIKDHKDMDKDRITGFYGKNFGDIKNIYEIQKDYRMRFEEGNNGEEQRLSLIKEKQENKNGFEEQLENIKKLLTRIEEQNKEILLRQKQQENIKDINDLIKEFSDSLSKNINKNDTKLSAFNKLDCILLPYFPDNSTKIYANINERFKDTLNKVFEDNSNNTQGKEKNNNNSFYLNYFYELLKFYFTSQILNIGYNKLILDNNSLTEMLQYSFELIKELLSKYSLLEQENEINLNAFNFIKASVLGESFASLSSVPNNVFRNSKISKFISKKNIELKRSFYQNYNSNSNQAYKNNTSNINGAPLFVSDKSPDIRASINDNLIQISNIPGFGYQKYNPSILSTNSEQNIQFMNKIASTESEKNMEQIRMISQILVNNIKETSHLKKDLRKMNDHFNELIKLHANYFNDTLSEMKSFMDISGSTPKKIINIFSSNKQIETFTSFSNIEIDSSRKELGRKSTNNNNIKNKSKISDIKENISKNLSKNYEDNIQEEILIIEKCTENESSINDKNKIEKIPMDKEANTDNEQINYTSNKIKILQKTNTDIESNSKSITNNTKNNKNIVPNIKLNSNIENNKDLNIPPKPYRFKKHSNVSEIPSNYIKKRSKPTNLTHNEHHIQVANCANFTQKYRKNSILFNENLQEKTDNIENKENLDINNIINENNRNTNVKYIQNNNKKIDELGINDVVIEQIDKLGHCYVKSEVASFNKNNSIFNKTFGKLNNTIDNQKIGSLDIEFKDSNFEKPQEMQIKEAIEKYLETGTATRKFDGIKLNYQNGCIKCEIAGGLGAEHKVGFTPLQQQLTKLEGDNDDEVSCDINEAKIQTKKVYTFSQ